jgi:hypothetical protein
VSRLLSGRLEGSHAAVAQNQCFRGRPNDERNEFNRMIRFVKNQKEDVSAILTRTKHYYLRSTSRPPAPPTFLSYCRGYALCKINSSGRVLASGLAITSSNSIAVLSDSILTWSCIPERTLFFCDAGVGSGMHLHTLSTSDFETENAEQVSCH